nr:hypothetical protein [Tanacetum cinerariifolium]
MLAVRDIAEVAEAQVPAQGLENANAAQQLEIVKLKAGVKKVEGLENANAAQQLEIVKLKAGVKKLERLNKVKSSKLRRLKKVGTSQCVESSDDVENVFNQGRNIVDMDQDEGIELVVDQEKDAEVEGRHADKHSKAYEEERSEYAKKLREELDKEHEESYKNIDWDAALDHTREEMEKEDEEIIKSINETPTQKAVKRTKLSEEAQEADDLKRRLEIVQDKDDDVFVEATPLAQKVPVVDYQVVVIDNKPKYKIIRADDTHQFYISFTTLLNNFDREDLETLWRTVKDRFSTSKPTNFSDEYLLLTLKTMF